MARGLRWELGACNNGPDGWHAGRMGGTRIGWHADGGAGCPRAGHGSADEMHGPTRAAAGERRRGAPKQRAARHGQHDPSLSMSVKGFRHGPLLWTLNLRAFQHVSVCEATHAAAMGP